MKHILCYGDSLAWGIIPGSRNRLPFQSRWTGVLQDALGAAYRVIEECLNGRTTAWEDPNRPGRHGLSLLQPTLESHAPLDLVILALGTNDLQAQYGATAEASAAGLHQLIQTIQASKAEPRFLAPPVLVIAPPSITAPAGAMAEKFQGAPERSAKLAGLYRSAAAAGGCHFLDAGQFIGSSPIDGIHLDEPAHGILGSRVATEVISILGSS